MGFALVTRYMAFAGSVTLPGLQTDAVALADHSNNIWEANAVDSLNDALTLSNDLSEKIQAALDAAQLQMIDVCFPLLLLPACRRQASRDFL